MLHTAKQLHGLSIRATDGAIGNVEDFLFDDEEWVIRYLVADAGTWLANRHVLISPAAIGRPDWSAKLLGVGITKDQVKNSPDIDTHKPVSRQHETEYLDYYGYGAYWDGAGIWGMGAYPGSPTTEDAVLAEMKSRRRAGAQVRLPEDSHLRSCAKVSGYHVHATDGDIGHVEDFIVDDQTWAIRYLVVNTSNWWLGHQVLVAPQWVREVSWEARTVSVDLTRKALEDAPRYDSAGPPDRPHEVATYTHHKRPDYWTTDAGDGPPARDL